MTRKGDGAGFVGMTTEYDTTSATPLSTVLVEQHFKYDAAGRQTHVAQVFDADGDGSVTWTPDPDGFPAPGPDVAITETQYDGAGRPRLVIDANVHSTETVYDELGRATKTVFDDHTVTETKYDQLGRREAEVRQHDPADVVELTTEQEKAEFFAARTTNYEYDLAGRLTAVVLPEVDNPAGAGRVRPRYEYVYDVYGNQVLVRDPMDDDLGGPENRETRFTHDHQGRQTSRTLPLGVDTPSDGTDFVERSFYDDTPIDLLGDTSVPTAGGGQLAFSVDFEGRITQYLYDNSPEGGGRLVEKRHYSDSQTVVVDENTAVGDFAALSNPDDVVAYAYDALGRETETVSQHNLNTASPSTHTATRQFDADGRLTRVATDEGFVNHAYDEMGRMTSTWTGDFSVKDAAGVPTRTDYAYDALGRLAEVDSVKLGGGAGAGVTAYRYDEAGNLEHVTGPAHGSFYEYDALNRLKKLTQFRDVDGTGDYDPASTDELIATFDYDVRADGKRSGVVEAFYDAGGVAVDHTNTFTWAYDNAGRLVGEALTSDRLTGYTDTFAYDLAANRLSYVHDSDNDADDESVAYAYDANDRLLTETSSLDGATTYGYNDAGEQTSKTDGGGTTNYRYDLRGRLVGVDTGNDGSDDVTYKYNDDGVRVAKSENGVVTQFVVDAHNPTGHAQTLEEKDASGAVQRSYVIGHDVIAQRDTDAGLVYLVYDGHGSTRALVDSSGQLVTPASGPGAGVAQVFAYNAYGEALGFVESQAATALLYSGEWFEVAVGVQYLRARYYDPATGRFSRLDPIRGTAADPLTFHKYLYGLGDPIGSIDPTGEYSLGVTVATIGTYALRASTAVSFATTGYKVATEGLEALTLWDALSFIPGLGYAGGALKYASTIRAFKNASLQFPTIAQRLTSVGGKLADLAGTVRRSTVGTLGNRMHEALKSSRFGQLLHRMRDLTATSSWVRIRIDQPIARSGLGSRPDITIEFPRARLAIALDMKPVPKRVFYEGGFLASYKYLFDSTEQSIRGRREGTLAIYRDRGFSTLYLYIPYPSFVR